MITLLAFAALAGPVDDPTPYVVVGPGIGFVDLEDGDLDLGLGFQWGAGGGVTFPIGGLRGALGGAFEHAINGQPNIMITRIRVGPEVRVGTGGGDLFVFGVAGVAVLSYRVRIDVLGVSVVGGDPGVSVSGGGGAWYDIADAWSLGGEVRLGADIPLGDEELPTLVPLQLRGNVVYRFR